MWLSDDFDLGQQSVVRSSFFPKVVEGEGHHTHQGIPLLPSGQWGGREDALNPE